MAKKQVFNCQLDMKVTSMAFGVFSSAAYVTCVIYGLVASSSFHHRLFELLPGVKWLDATSFLVGLVDMFLIGAFYSAMFVLIYNCFVKNAAKQKR